MFIVYQYFQDRKLWIINNWILRVQLSSVRRLICQMLFSSRTKSCFVEESNWISLIDCNLIEFNRRKSFRRRQGSSGPSCLEIIVTFPFESFTSSFSPRTKTSSSFDRATTCPIFFPPDSRKTFVSRQFSIFTILSMEEMKKTFSRESGDFEIPTPFWKLKTFAIWNTNAVPATIIHACFRIAIASTKSRFANALLVVVTNSVLARFVAGFFVHRFELAIASIKTWITWNLDGNEICKFDCDEFDLSEFSGRLNLCLTNNPIETIPFELVPAMSYFNKFEFNDGIIGRNRTD